MRTGRRELDALWPEQHVIVELDDHATHGSVVMFRSDRERDLDHLALDHETIRLTREMLTAETAEKVRRILSRRTPAAPRPPAGPRPS